MGLVPPPWPDSLFWFGCWFGFFFSYCPFKTAVWCFVLVVGGFVCLMVVLFLCLLGFLWVFKFLGGGNSQGDWKTISQFLMGLYVCIFCSPFLCSKSHVLLSCCLLKGNLALHWYCYQEGRIIAMSAVNFSA